MLRTVIDAEDGLVSEIDTEHTVECLRQGARFCPGGFSTIM
jgi:hypothetical protein